ncbi:hypothetical protein [Oleomonas cavernae]|uniref:hypothetical protein n=1 Tax=Oleomonas cavernae TaxID=2320859 RepID=UPI0011C49686|nr:hypothetical protein [Oleomonas cavernae]
MLRRVTRPTLRFGTVVLLVGALGLGGCVSNSYSLGGSDYDEPLTPAQAALRDQTDRFNETVGTGVAAGAILGALLGAAVDSDDRGRGRRSARWPAVPWAASRAITSRPRTRAMPIPSRRWTPASPRPSARPTATARSPRPRPGSRPIIASA